MLLKVRFVFPASKYCASGTRRQHIQPLLCFVFLVDDEEALQEQVLVEDDVLLAVGDDLLCESAGGDDRGLLAELFLDAVDDAVQGGSAAVENAALHALDGVLPDDVLRCVDADAAELRGTRGEGIERNADTRQDHTADVLLLTVDDGNRGRGTHVDHDERYRILMEAGDGVMQFLEEKGIGFDTSFGLVPIVCGASLFDLELVTNKVRPDKAMGYQACVNAYSGKEPEMGNFGAGTGATVGKWLGDAAYMKSGLGIYAVQLGALQVAAIVSVNALGDIINYDDGHIMAGLLNADKTGFADTCDAMYQTVEQTRELWGSHPDPEIASHTNTTISCILTNARLDKCQCNKLAAIANDGYARGIRPVHTSADGDSIFVMASGEVEVGFDAVAALACECMARAINRSASEAKPAYGLLSAQSFR